MSKPIISIVIVSYNGKHHLKNCFDSIISQDFKQVEVIVVDNGSQDGTVEYIRKNYSQFKIYESSENLGFALGNNMAMPLVEGEFVFFLNNDTILKADCLARIAKRIEYNRVLSKTKLEVYAPMMVRWEDHNIVDSGGDEVYTWGGTFKYENYPVNHPLFSTERSIANGCGGAVIYPKKLFESLGGFDPDFFLIFEDVDLSMRARHAGADIVFIPDARVVHKGSASIGHMSFIQMYYGSRNLLLAKVKNYPLVTLLKYAPPSIFTALLTLRRAILRGQTNAFVKGKIDQIKLLPKMLRKRKTILDSSNIDRAEFERWLRKGWFKERLLYRHKVGDRRW